MDEDKKDIIEVEKVEDTENEPVLQPEEKEEQKAEEPKVEVVKEPEKDKRGFSIAALVLGIIAIVLCCIWYISIPCGILAIIFGIVGIKSSKKGMSIAGLVTGAIGLIISVLIFFALVIFGMAIGITEGLDDTIYDSSYFDRYDYNKNLFD